MKKQSKIILAVILVAVLCMAIGYAAVGSVDLYVNGTASATASQDNFKVYFTGEGTPSSAANVEIGTVTKTEHDNDTITVDISNLTKKGDIEYAILEIENGSNDLDASSIEVTLDDVDTTYFNITAERCDSTGVSVAENTVLPCKPGDDNKANKTYVKVSAELLQTPTVDNISTSINVKIVATPAAL